MNRVSRCLTSVAETYLRKLGGDAERLLSHFRGGGDEKDEVLTDTVSLLLSVQRQKGKLRGHLSWSLYFTFYAVALSILYC